MKLDVFTHVHPKRFLDRLVAASPQLGGEIALVYGVNALHDMDVRFRLMDTVGGDYRQVLCLSGPSLDTLPPAQAVELSRLANDEMAALVADHPDRFEGFAATLPMNTATEPSLADAALRESERAIRELGALGVQVHTQVAGRPVTAPETMQVFDVVAGLNGAVWLHPERGQEHHDYMGASRSEFEIWFALGWPHETSVAMAHIVFSGVFDRHPELVIIAHQMGGTIPYLEGRIANVWERLGARTPDRPYVALRQAMTRRPVDYFRMFHSDTVGAVGPTALQCCTEFFGVDRLMYASDAPFGPNGGQGYLQSTMASLDALAISSQQRQAIYEHNARRALRLLKAATSS
ncbi:amidohydrolase family protein [soil metagenome]